VFATVLDDAQEGYKQGAVQVQGIVESQAPVRQEYNPSHPMANEDGYIFHSNVDPITEMANMMSASRSYQNNVEIANTSKQLLLRTLQLGQ
jgi:flagellar basal-body rod protein FlgC